MMKKLACVLLLLFLVFLSGPVHAFWKAKVTNNQINVTDYVLQLKEGGDPDTLQRPHLRTDTNYKAKQANKEMRRIMDAAEELARRGKHEEIEDPQFAVRGLSDEGAEQRFERQPVVKE